MINIVLSLIALYLWVKLKKIVEGKYEK